MRLEADLKLGFKDVLIRPKRSTLKSRSEVSLLREYRFLHSARIWRGVPVVAANMDTVGTFAMAEALSQAELLTAVHKYYHLEDWKGFMQSHPKAATNYSLVSTGSSETDMGRLKQVIEALPDLQFICVDVANGYTQHFVDFVKRVREEFRDKTIFAGNVVTGEMVEELILAGADAVKVGIGPGSVCTTRVKTGIGYPQLSAVIECADAAHGLGGHVVSDGGCVSPGDISKAFGAGADFVMLGGMLAGHKEGGGKVKTRDGREFVDFYGMSSETAMDRYAGGVAEYRASEGKLVDVPYRGPVAATLSDVLGGLRSTCTYVGASSLKELSKRTTFVRVAEQENTVYS